MHWIRNNYHWWKLSFIQALVLVLVDVALVLVLVLVLVLTHLMYIGKVCMYPTSRTMCLLRVSKPINPRTGTRATRTST